MNSLAKTIHLASFLIGTFLCLTAAANGESNITVAIGQPSVFWHEGKWQVFADGQWMPYVDSKEPSEVREQWAPTEVIAPPQEPEPFTNNITYSYPGSFYAPGAYPVSRHLRKGRKPHENKSPASGLGQPNIGIGQPTIGIGQPNGAIGQPTIGIGQPAAGIGQPNTTIGQTTIGIGQPNGGVGRPNVEIGKANNAIGQTTIGIGQQAAPLAPPNVQIGQPASGLGKTTIGIGRPLNSPRPPSNRQHQDRAH